MNIHYTTMWLFISGVVAHPHIAKRQSYHGEGKLMRTLISALL